MAKAKTRRKVGFSISLYRFLEKTPARKILHDLRTQIVNITPYDYSSLEVCASGMVLVSFAFGAVGAFVALMLDILTRGFSPYTIASIVFTVWATFHIATDFQIKNFSRKVSNEFSVYLTNVIYNYQNNRTLIRAMQNAALGASNELNAINDKLISILEDEHASDKVHSFMSDRNASPYVKLFLSQCYNAYTRGDITHDNESLFCKNVEHLRADMLNAELRAQEQDYVMKGLEVIAAIPVPILNVFYLMCLNFDAEMKMFYDSYGPLIQILVVFVSVYVCKLIQKNKDVSLKIHSSSKLFEEIDDKIKFDIRFRNTNKIRRMLELTGDNTPVSVFYLKSVLWGIVAVIMALGIMVYSNLSYRRSILVSEDIDNVTVVNSLREEAKNMIIDMSQELKNKDMSEYSDEYIINMINERIFIPNLYTKISMAQEIRSRVGAYQSRLVLTWWQFALSLLASALCLMPYIELNSTYTMLQSKKIDEVQLFQMLILLEKDFKDTTVYSLLNKMASYTMLYRREFNQALSTYPYDPKHALMILAQIDDVEIREIISQLDASDKVGLQMACANIETNMLITERTKKQMTEIADESYKNKISIVSAIPAAVAFVGYFVIPFITTSLKDTSGMFEVMQNLNA